MKIVDKLGTPFEQLVIYGGPKSLKTRTATAPRGDKWEPIGYVAADARVPKGGDVEAFTSIAMKSVLDPDRLVIATPTGEPNVLQESHDIIEWAGAQAKEGRIKTLVWDPFTVTAETLLQEYADNGITGAPAATLGSREKGTWHTAPGKHHYGAVHGSVMFLLQALRKLPLNLILVFHEEFDDAEGNIDGMVGGPKTVGSAQIRIIPGIFDTIRTKCVQVAPGKTQVVASTVREGIWLAGIRSRQKSLPASLVLESDPVNFWKLFDEKGPQ